MSLSTQHHNHLYQQQQQQQQQQQPPAAGWSTIGSPLHHHQQQHPFGVNAATYGSNVHRLRSVFYPNLDQGAAPSSLLHQPQQQQQQQQPKHLSRLADLRKSAQLNGLNGSGAASPFHTADATKTTTTTTISTTTISSADAALAQSNSANHGTRSRSLSTPRNGWRPLASASPPSSLASATSANASTANSNHVHQSSINVSVTLNSDDHLTRFQSAKALFARMEEESAKKQHQLQQQQHQQQQQQQHPMQVIHRLLPVSQLPMANTSIGSINNRRSLSSGLRHSGEFRVKTQQTYKKHI